MPKTQKGKAGTEDGKAGKSRRKRKTTGDPITVGGGGGRKRKGRKARIPDSQIKFKRDVYKRKRSHEYESATDVMLGLDISCVDDGPAIAQDSVVQIYFSDSRTPNTNERTSITITGQPLGIKFTGDWIDKGPTKFHCSYLMIREVYVDGELVVRLSENDGDCTVNVYNRLLRRRRRR